MSESARVGRRRAYSAGRWAETLCAWLLRCKGCRIIARRYRSPVGKIDIIARRGEVLAAIEVKVRASLAEAAESIIPRQRERIIRATSQFLAQHDRLARLAVRFDAMLVVPCRWPVLMWDAWRP
jgi:putative endonuclease